MPRRPYAAGRVGTLFAVCSGGKDNNSVSVPTARLRWPRSRAFSIGPTWFRTLTGPYAILDRHGDRLRHVHLHDNRGGSQDLHLPLGAGNLDTRRHVRALKAAGYDGTITLEVFTPDWHYLAYSRDVLRRLWDEA
jgi:hypothetical protein